MSELILERYSYGPHCVEGQLFMPNTGLRLWTLERPWNNNQPNVSCIPEGVYKVELWKRASNSQECLIVSGGTVGKIPMDLRQEGIKRWGILFHGANLVQELEGCIGVGQRCHPGIIHDSRKAMVQLMDFTAGQQLLPLELTIRQKQPFTALA